MINQIKKHCEYFESPKEGNQGFTSISDHCSINPRGVKLSITVTSKPIQDIIESTEVGNIHRTSLKSSSRAVISSRGVL
jgi:hypothetical protein